MCAGSTMSTMPAPRLPQNLDAQQRDMESSVFAVTLAGVQALDHGTSGTTTISRLSGGTISAFRSRLADGDTAVTTMAAGPQ